MRNVLDKTSGKTTRKLFVFNTFIPNSDLCEIMWKNMIETDRPQRTLQHCEENM
jgi:hypothetical protein